MQPVYWVNVNLICELCFHAHISLPWQPHASGWQWYYKKYIDVKKGGVGGVGMLLAGYCVLSYIWSYPRTSKCARTRAFTAGTLSLHLVAGRARSLEEVPLKMVY